MAEGDSKVCAITAAMTDGTGLAGFAEQFKSRFFDVGIAEEHAVVFAAGLARNGMLPVFAVYSTFLQRTYDQIIHDAALQKLKVVFAIDRAGIVGEDGETHQGIFDAAFLNSIPGMTVFCPAAKEEMHNFLYAAMYECEGPAAVRYPRGAPEDLPLKFHPTCGNYDIYTVCPDTEVLIVTYGRLFFEAARAVQMLEKHNIHAAVLKLNRIKPIDEECYKLCGSYKKIFFFEEGIKTGGIGEHFGMGLYSSGTNADYSVHAINDKFVVQGGVGKLLSELGLDAEGMVSEIIKNKQ